MNLSKDEENQIRKAIEAMEEEIRFVLEVDTAGAIRDWADEPGRERTEQPGDA